MIRSKSTLFRWVFIHFVAIVAVGFSITAVHAQSISGSCYNPNKQICISLQSGFTGTEAASSCPSSSGGLFSQAPCPAGSTVGRCTNVYQGKTIVGYFYGPYWNADTALSKCQRTQGNFTAL
jgi:hypothetical protein